MRKSITGLLMLIVFLPSSVIEDKKKLENRLLNASRENNCEEIEGLLSSGVNPDAKDVLSGKTPLIIASRKGYECQVDLLISYNAKINTTDKLNWSALTWAKIYRQDNIIKKLKKAGAKTDNTKDIFGKTASYWVNQTE